MTKAALEIAREYFPNNNNAELDYIIWEQTGFPCFWNTPQDGATPEECFRKQLADFAACSRKDQG